MSLVTPTLSYLQNSEKTLPMLLIEVPTTLGRTYQGYKRGGKPEARERICEETLGAAVWLFGAKAFNKAGDFAGEKILGLKDLNTDVGRDALRDPFSNVTDKRAITAAFKFSKIALSSLFGILAMGMVVPKIKKAMTNAMRAKSGLPLIPDKDGTYTKSWADKLVGKFIKPDENKKESTLSFLPDMKTFSDNLEQNNSDTYQKQNFAENSPSFKGGCLMNAVLYASHNLENSTPWRLLTTDAGTLAGRIANSRTKKEQVEYAFRDSISSIAYVFAAPAFSSFLRKTTSTPNVHPKGSEAIAEHLSGIVQNEGGAVETGFFSSKFGLSKDANETLKNLKFDKNGIISLSDFDKQTLGQYSEKARKMSALQPALKDNDGIRRAILSKKEVSDVLSNSYTSDPDFLKKAISLVTNGKSDNEKKFISRKKLENIRDSFDDFVTGLEKYAKKKGSDINSELINKYAKSLNRKNLAIHMAGIAFAVSCLAFLIPKLQYVVSDKIAGNGGFAGSLESDTNV